MVYEGKECSGSEINKGHYSDIGSCANDCRGIASMFIFQRNDSSLGTDGCDNAGTQNAMCSCYCETAANSDRTCAISDLPNYDLYAITGNYGWEASLKPVKLE